MAFYLLRTRTHKNYLLKGEIFIVANNFYNYDWTYYLSHHLDKVHMYPNSMWAKAVAQWSACSPPNLSTQGRIPLKRSLKASFVLNKMPIVVGIEFSVN